MKKINTHEDGKFTGYVKNTESHRWWLDEKLEDAFEYFDLDTFYNEDYFKTDHVGDIVANNYVLYVMHYFKQIANRELKNVL